MTGTKHRTPRSVVSASLRARRQKKARRALVSYAIAAGVLYAGAWHLAHHPTFAVTGIAIEGAASASEVAVAAAARSALASPALSLMPMTNAYLARTDLVAEAVESALPEVASATVARRDLELVVLVEERERFGYWCRASTGSGQAAGGNEDCFALDSNGLIFARATPPSDATRFSGLVAAADPIRERYAPAETWASLAAVVAALREKGFSPTSVSTADGADFKVTLAEGPYLLVDAAYPGAQALENLRVALGDDSLNSLRAYTYADLRLPHKVFLRPADVAGAASDDE